MARFSGFYQPHAAVAGIDTSLQLADYGGVLRDRHQQQHSANQREGRKAHTT